MEMYYGSKGIDNFLDIRLGYLRELSKNGISYQITMLGENEIKGLIKPTIRETDGVIWLRYNNNSLYMLDRLFCRHKPDWRMVRQMMGQILECMSEVEEYLLNQDDLVIDPRYMFYSRGEEAVRLVCIPGYSVNIRAQFKSLLEYIMSRFDISDRDGITQLYSLYDIITDEGADFPAYVKALNNYGLGEAVNNEELKHAYNRVENYRDYSDSDYAGEEDYKFEDRAPRKKLMAGISTLFSRFNKAASNTKQDNPMYNNCDTDGLTVYNDCSQDKRLRRLIPLTNGALPELDMRGNNDIITIGRDKDSASYSIDTTQISRVHACIFREKSDIFLEDCNSTNGTYINYRRIPAMEPVKVNAGDIVGFANEEFYVS